MKNDKEKQKDIDATAAWLMKQYTLAVQEALKFEPDDGAEMPEELDKKCRELIKKEVRKQRYKQIAKKAGRFTCAAMLTVVMLFGVVGILFTTVEAVRAPSSGSSSRRRRATWKSRTPARKATRAR